ncbi:putative JmjC domain-containing protein [Septoria linicola]|nr:putative JmjC domain-containing protein [Septoria linicola]
MASSDDDIERLIKLKDYITERLDKPVTNDCIHLCGLSVFHIIVDNPEEVLKRASEYLHAWPYAEVPTCWRRLYEDASLHLAVKLLRRRLNKLQSTTTAVSLATMNPAKRMKLDLSTPKDEDWIEEFCKIMDRAVIISGAPGRKALIDDVLKELEVWIAAEWQSAQPRRLPTPRPRPLDTDFPIMRIARGYEFEEFQMHLETTAAPVIMPGTFERWPARTLWEDVNYLKYRTLGGNRIVPVEIGSSYNESGWSQKVMNFAEFVERYLIPDQPESIGYLAQHDLFEQIPSLKNDISIPDYCWTNPPQPEGAAAETAGLKSTKQLDEPLLNAWLGPAGTKTPLHTDPYHNILCQVIGYKYIRLYKPEDSKYMYPSGVDDTGINMDNTSQVDVVHFRPELRAGEPEYPAALKEQIRKYPLFGRAECQEAILGPGECLYIPLGWWHYVESVTASFSVSFWWN